MSTLEESQTAYKGVAVLTVLNIGPTVSVTFILVILSVKTITDTQNTMCFVKPLVLKVLENHILTILFQGSWSVVINWRHSWCKYFIACMWGINSLKQCMFANHFLFEIICYLVEVCCTILAKHTGTNCVTACNSGCSRWLCVRSALLLFVWLLGCLGPEIDRIIRAQPPQINLHTLHPFVLTDGVLSPLWQNQSFKC